MSFARMSVSAGTIDASTLQPASILDPLFRNGALLAKGIKAATTSGGKVSLEFEEGVAEDERVQVAQAASRAAYMNATLHVCLDTRPKNRETADAYDMREAAVTALSRYM